MSIPEAETDWKVTLSWVALAVGALAAVLFVILAVVWVVLIVLSVWHLLVVV